jgi:threonine/homoserine/homoserine lactone efflux protein
MDFTQSLFISGVIIGLGVAAPVGPVATFIIRQTLTFGLLSGLVAGFSTAISKGFYAWLATFLSSFIEVWIDSHSQWFYLISGLFLMYIGVKVILTHIKYNNNDKKPLEPSLVSSFLQTLLLTFLSPMTAILFLGWFNAMGIFHKIETTSDVAAVVMGVMVGTMLWWTLLTTVVSTVQKKYDLKIFKYINLIAGTVIILFSLVAIGKAILGTK